MNPLSQLLSPHLIEQLKEKTLQGKFPGLDFTTAMQFILTDGLMPKSGLPAESFLRLEDWVRSEATPKTAQYTATELKNKTGEILERVLKGQVIELFKHGRLVATIRPAGS